MNRTPLVIVCFALFCVVVCSGQQRRTNRPPQRQASVARPQTPPKPVTPQPEESTGEAVPWTPIQYLLPEDIQWPQTANPASPRNVTLIGNPRDAAMYVTRTRIPKGTKGVPHIHPDTRTVVVISGTYYYGNGDEFDETKLVPLPPGSLILEPAGEPHFSWARDGEVVVQTTGIGPTETRFPPRKPTPQPPKR